MEKEIKETVSGLLEAIARKEQERIESALAWLDGIVAQRSSELHPQLAHFLQNRNYAKAFAFLGGTADIPARACGAKGN
jgi:hypothetical protein